ncbi:MAG: hypothetical protein FJ303_13325 [Planctomycetes bacterium]|nr:hypothetical protein [Planctomycetota bacterium]
MAIAWGLIAFADGSALADKKKEKNPLEGKKGTVVGILVAKEKAAIFVKGDGQEEARRYVPQWVGNASGGPDKEVLKIFHDLKIGSRIEVEWVFEERLRALKVKVLREPPSDKKDEPKRGKTVGAIVSRENNKWIEVKSDGEEKARKYYVHAKLPDKLLAAVREAPIGSRVAVEFVLTNHGPIIHAIEVVRVPNPK